MVRQAHLVAVVGTFLVAIVAVGCGTGTGKIDERDGERGPAANKAETTASVGERTAAGTPREPVGLDFEVVSPVGRANRPEGFGGGTLWATDFEPTPAACDDVVEPGEGPCSAWSASGSASAPASASPAGEGSPTLLKRVDPRTGEVVAEIPIEDVGVIDPELAFGAGSVWVCNGNYFPGPLRRYPGDVVLRVDPETNLVVDRIPVDSPTGLAFGHGSVWVVSAGYGTLSRIDPKTGEVAAKIEVGRGAVDVAVDGGSGDVWVAGVSLSNRSYSGSASGSASGPASRGSSEERHEDNNLSRVDPAKNHVVAEIPIREDSPNGGASNVIVGEGAVWALSDDGRLLKVDPETNEVAAMVSVGEYSSSLLEVYGGGVWTILQAGDFRLVRVDPRTVQVVASEYLRPFDEIAYGGLAAGGGYVWFSSGDGLARIAP